MHDDLAMIATEAYILNLLNHPNIIRVKDMGGVHTEPAEPPEHHSRARHGKHSHSQSCVVNHATSYAHQSSLLTW
eukprot:7859968-Pyramimonas_sp.AAC.2